MSNRSWTMCCEGGVFRRERRGAVAAHYQHFGGRSPINDHNRALVSARCSAELAAHGHDCRCTGATATGTPSWPTPSARCAPTGSAGPWRSSPRPTPPTAAATSTWRTSHGPGRRSGPRRPVIDKLRVFYNHPGFVQANADALEAAAGRGLCGRRRIGPGGVHRPQHPPGHGRHLRLPAATHRDGPPGDAPGRPGGPVPWSLVFQSRSGPPTVPWLEPDILDHLRDAGRGRSDPVVVAPIGFVADHMEVVYDLDLEAAQRAAQLGLPMVRAATAGIPSGLRHHDPPADRGAARPAEPQLALGPRRALPRRVPRRRVARRRLAPAGWPGRWHSGWGADGPGRAASFGLVASHDAGVQVACPGCAQIVLAEGHDPGAGRRREGHPATCARLRPGPDRAAERSRDRFRRSGGGLRHRPKIDAARPQPSLACPDAVAGLRSPLESRRNASASRPSASPPAAALAARKPRRNPMTSLPGANWLTWRRSAATLRSKVSVTSTKVLGLDGAHDPHLVDHVGGEPLGQQLREGEGVAGVGVDGAQRGLARRHVVGMAGEDAAPVALRRLAHDPLGPDLADHPGDVPPQVQRHRQPAVGIAEPDQVGDADLLGRRRLLGPADAPGCGRAAPTDSYGRRRRRR